MLNHNFVDANFPKYCMGEMGTKRKKNLTILVFSYTTYFSIVRVYIKTSALSGCIQKLQHCQGVYKNFSIVRVYTKTSALSGCIQKLQHCQGVYKNFSIVRVYTKTSALSGCIQNLKTLALTAGEKSVMNFYQKERQMDTKENDKYEDPYSLLNNTTSHTQCLYQISKS